MIGKLFENLPLVIFGLLFAISFIIFIIGAIISASAKDTVRLTKGKEVLMTAVYSFSIFLLSLIVFSSVTWFLDRSIEEDPTISVNDYPVSPVNFNFPSPPKNIRITDTYFNGPYPIRDFGIITESAIFSVLCKSEDDYDIIDIDRRRELEELEGFDNYECWNSLCNDLYFGIFWIPDNYGREIELIKSLKEENNLTCPILEE